MRYFDKLDLTLTGVMSLNENFDKMVKAAPHCPFNEGEAFQKWFLECAKQWLKLTQVEFIKDLLSCVDLTEK